MLYYLRMQASRNSQLHLLSKVGGKMQLLSFNANNWIVRTLNSTWGWLCAHLSSRFLRRSRNASHLLHYAHSPCLRAYKSLSTQKRKKNSSRYCLDLTEPFVNHTWLLLIPNDIIAFHATFLNQGLKACPQMGDFILAMLFAMKSSGSCCQLTGIEQSNPRSQLSSPGIHISTPKHPFAAREVTFPWRQLSEEAGHIQLLANTERNALLYSWRKKK